MKKDIEAEANALANQILDDLDAVVCYKLREMKTQIQRLRSYFKKLHGKGLICGCRTWDEFCTQRLRRTRRAVTKMLAGPRKKRESPPEWDEEKGDLTDYGVRKLNRECGRPAGEGLPEKIRKVERQVSRPTVTFQEDLQEVCEVAGRVLYPDDTTQDLERKIGLILEVVIPKRRFNIDIGEADPPPKRKRAGGHYEQVPQHTTDKQREYGLERLKWVRDEPDEPGENPRLTEEDMDVPF